MNDLKISYLRQTDLFDPAKHQAVIAIIGCGNIGSNAGMALARLGIKSFILYDHDKIERHNLPSQYYDVAHVGRYKVDMLKKQMQAVNPDVVVETYREEYQGQPLKADILISAVDSVDARRHIAECMTANKYDPLVVDGRSGGGQIEVHTQPLHDWLATIPAEADEDPCGSRFVCYASMAIGAFIANQVRRAVCGLPVKSRVLFHMDTYQIVVQ